MIEGLLLYVTYHAKLAKLSSSKNSNKKMRIRDLSSPTLILDKYYFLEFWIICQFIDGC